MARLPTTPGEFATLSPQNDPKTNFGRQDWGRVMIRLIIDVVLFSCMFALVTGIVLAAAHVLG
jgi:hypothetical protein